MLLAGCENVQAFGIRPSGSLRLVVGSNAELGKRVEDTLARLVTILSVITLRKAVTLLVVRWAVSCIWNNESILGFKNTSYIADKDFYFFSDASVRFRAIHPPSHPPIYFL
jgi:hypothetical protein